MADAFGNDTEHCLLLLKNAVRPLAPAPGDFATSIPGFSVHRRDVPNIPEVCFNKPIAALTLQGCKRTVIGSEDHRYGAGHCLVAGVDLPSLSHITDASVERPYLVLTLDLDAATISALADEPSFQQPVPNHVRSGLAVAAADIDILNAFLRLLHVIEDPDKARALGPLIVREIHVRLLLGPHGPVLHALNTRGTRSNRVFQAVNWLRAHFNQPLDVDTLAERVHMAPPTFRRHFKTVTTMSPTRYHQHLRLYEAQRLMLTDGLDAVNAGYAVGYESPTQFNREYKRLFGAPPGRNIRQVRRVSTAEAAAAAE